MYLTTHSQVGALIGAACGDPLVGFVAGFISHSVLDMIPHHDYRGTAEGIADFAIGLILLLAALFMLPQHRAVSMLMGALGGAVPDIEVAINHFSGGGRRLLYPSHNGLLPHSRLGYPWGALLQVLIVALALAGMSVIGRI